jgi:hypothetical protein
MDEKRLRGNKASLTNPISSGQGHAYRLAVRVNLLDNSKTRESLNAEAESEIASSRASPHSGANEPKPPIDDARCGANELRGNVSSRWI